VEGLLSTDISCTMLTYIYSAHAPCVIACSLCRTVQILWKCGRLLDNDIDLAICRGFLPRDAMHCADYVVARCLSVSVSLWMWYAGILSKRLNISLHFFSPLVTKNSSFSTPNGIAIFRREPCNGGVKCKGYEKIEMFHQYLALHRKWYSHSYYERQIGTCTQVFEWYRFQWPWVTWVT